MTATLRPPEAVPLEADRIRKALQQFVAQGPARQTLPELEKRLVRELGCTKTDVRAAVRNLVQDRCLVYTYRYGCSFLELSYDRPVRVSSRVVLKPPALSYQPRAGDIVVTLQAGIAFGSGEHATTRLAISALEEALARPLPAPGPAGLKALDIGTGSGVLAISAVLMGMGSAVGVDIDPCARAEARANVALNRLEAQVMVPEAGLEAIDTTFAMVMANLRYPTLRRLAPRIAAITEPDGVLIVSGIHTDEVEDLVTVYARQGFTSVWTAHAQGWTALAAKLTGKAT